ncbi:hypothetical protein GF327_06760 [Candidatus Woesearchaeota archaeon]|nr:hypothetical protein [Candidatus Woesearchaeota archaeon]
MIDYSDKKIHEVECSFCNEKITCPEDMLDSDKHACYSCFNELKDKLSEDEKSKIHVDMPMSDMADMLLDTMIEIAYPEFWKENKSKIIQMSKKEIAEEMFAAGASAVVEMMMHAHENPEDVFS